MDTQNVGNKSSSKDLIYRVSQISTVKLCQFFSHWAKNILSKINFFDTVFISISYVLILQSVVLASQFSLSLLYTVYYFVQIATHVTPANHLLVPHRCKLDHSRFPIYRFHISETWRVSFRFFPGEKDATANDPISDGRWTVREVYPRRTIGHSAI